MADVTLRFTGDSTSAVRAARSTDAALGHVRGTSRLLGAAFLSLGITAAGSLALGLGKALSLAGDFEASLNTFQAVSSATGDEMKRVSNLAKQLGADLTLPGTSAKDAADAMTELAKGGLSVRDAMAAARGTLQLSAAAEIENADAATIVADALNSFGLAGSDAGRVADLLAASANATTAEIGDMAAALKQSSAVANQLGIPIQEVVTELGELANAGIKGSDAGTSLRTMLLRLGAPSAQAAAAMKDLGVNVFDAQGQFKPMPAIIDEFSKATADLTDKQRAAAFQTIFGTDAIRAANIVLRGGLKPHDEMAKAVGRQGAAAELAAAKMKGYKGALEGFKSTVETFAVTIGTFLLPTATKVVNKLSELVGFLDKVAGAKSPSVALHITFAGIESAVGTLFDSLRAALFGQTTRKPLKLPTGQILEWDERSTDGLVSDLAAALVLAIRKTDWSSIPGALNDAIAKAGGAGRPGESDQERFVRWLGLDPHHDYSKDFDAWLRKQLSHLERSIIEGLTPDTGATKGWLSDQLDLPGARRLFVRFDRILDRFASTVKDRLSGLASWVASTWQHLLLGAVLGGVAPLASAGARLGKAVVDAVINWLKSLPGRVGSFITSAAASIGGHIDEFFRNGVALGEALVSGVLSGLTSLFSRVAGAISGAVSSAVGWAKGHIGSTAEEYAARQLGVPLAEGVAGGFESRSRDIRRRMAASLRDAIPAAGGTGLGGGALAGAGGGNLTVHVPIHFHAPVGEPRKFATQVAREVERQVRRNGAVFDFGA